MNKTKVKISFVGDILCEMEQNIARYSLEEDRYNYDDLFTDVSKDLNSGDFLVGNLETPLGGNKLGYTNHMWSFNSPESFARKVKEAGFDLVSTANNHCLDRGINGLKQTIDTLDQIELDHIGTYKESTDRQQPFIKCIKGIKVGFLAYTYGTNANFNNLYLKRDQRHHVNLLKKQERKTSTLNIIKRLQNNILKDFSVLARLKKEILTLKRDLDKLRKEGAEYTILLLHCGGQYNIEPDPYTIALIRYLNSLEVDAIIGSHPHVVQKCLIESNKVNAYSLGNFLTVAGVEIKPFGKTSEYGVILNILLEKKNNKVELSSVTFIITKSIKSKSGGAKVVALFDLIESCPEDLEKHKLIRDYETIVRRFANFYERQFDYKKEYFLPLK